MLLQPFYLACLAHASYLVADEESRVAAVIDPQRDTERYLAYAEEQGLELRYVILTHFHADFVSGHLELRAQAGAEVVVGPRAQPEFAHRVLAEGDALDLGPRVRLSCLETPGHTPEGISIVVRERAEGDAPRAVFTGDTLFVGDVGRPDLMASVGVTAAELGGMLYDSLHDKLLRLPDETLVYPAHGAGSLCGKALSDERVSSIGKERAHNYALQPMSQADFVALVSADQPPTPRYFAYDARLNRQERGTLPVMLAGLAPLELDQVVALQAEEGAQVLDARPRAEFAAGHLRGSINVGLAGRFATWAGAVLDPERPIVVVAAPGAEGEAALRLGRIGLDRVVGYLSGGFAALGAHPERVATLPQLRAEELREQLALGAAPTLLDVRRASEFAAGHIPGALNIPLSQLPARLDEVPGEGELVVSCQSGFRSTVAASLLAAEGRPAQNLVGGWQAWSALPLGAGS